MSQPALWAMMRMLHIPDVDFLEELYEFSTVRLAPNGEREATIRFQTGVAQGSPLSPTLFLIFINTLARLLTEVGRAENIEHGVDGVPGFNNIFFADDMSLFVQTEQGLQRLLDITQGLGLTATSRTRRTIFFNARRSSSKAFATTRLHRKSPWKFSSAKQ